MALHRALRNTLGTLMGLAVSKTWVPGLRVGNLPGPKLQLENSRLEEMAGSSVVVSEILGTDHINLPTNTDSSNLGLHKESL